jgi:hypothetical protein
MDSLPKSIQWHDSLIPSSFLHTDNLTAEKAIEKAKDPLFLFLIIAIARRNAYSSSSLFTIGVSTTHFFHSAVVTRLVSG